jgi:hypothetical protein
MSPSRRIAGSIGKHHSLLGYVLLEDVGLDRAAEPVGRHAAFLGGHHVVGEHDRRGRVDRHRHAHLPQVDAAEEGPHVVERVYRDPLAADLAQRERGVRVMPHERRHIEGGGQPGLAVVEQVAEALIGVLGATEARELAHRPQPPAVHRGIDATREGKGARDADARTVRQVGVGVQGSHRLAGEGRELDLPLRGEVVGLQPLGVRSGSSVG